MMSATPYTAAALELIERRSDPLEQLLEVNRTLLRVLRHESDQALYGCKQLVVSVEETLRRGAGDCEDYAWVCHQLSVELGVPAEDLTIQWCRINTGEQHAVLSYRRGELLIDSLIEVPRPGFRRYDLSEFREMDKACFPEREGDVVPGLRFA